MTFEDKLALKFAPTYVSSAGEDCYLVQLEEQTVPKVALGYPPWKPCIYYSVFKHNPRGNEISYEINYLSIWDRDTGGPLGITPHIWDTERSAVLVAGSSGDKDPSKFEAIELFYARHGFLDEYIPAKYKEKGPIVYWSLGKHASYPTYPYQGIINYDVFKQPEERVEPNCYTLKNAGTCDKPNAHTPWVAYKDNWGPNQVSSVYWKLKDPLWKIGRTSNEWTPIRQPALTTADQVKFVQNGLGLPPTGTIDHNFMARVYTINPDIIRNAPYMEEELFSDLVKLKPDKISPYTMGSILNKEISLQSVLEPKKIDGKVSGMKNAKALNLGKIGPETMLYGLIEPEDNRILGVVSAPIETVMERKILASKLKNWK